MLMSRYIQGWRFHSLSRKRALCSQWQSFSTSVSLAAVCGPLLYHLPLLNHRINQLLALSTLQLHLKCCSAGCSYSASSLLSSCRPFSCCSQPHGSPPLPCPFLVTLKLRTLHEAQKEPSSFLYSSSHSLHARVHYAVCFMYDENNKMVHSRKTWSWF